MSAEPSVSRARFHIQFKVTLLGKEMYGVLRIEQWKSCVRKGRVLRFELGTGKIIPYWGRMRIAVLKNG